ncbi:hypothetical protein INT46_003473 [Mucor plumbeus]|uniref:Uncharacterized protein n=1 Tax=Mucor plumbeus TaxID=97098 RepID=A0A8H7V8K2_9FUNG|nr:hypothetical protein INT46_003473 [Mucor plumbeus]
MRRQNANNKKKYVTIISKYKWKPSKFQQDKAKVPLIAFGAGMFGKPLVKLKSNKCGVVGVLWHALKKQEKEKRNLVVTSDEFMTSRQRYINAAKNMLLNSSLIWNGDGRPEVFSPKARI